MQAQGNAPHEGLIRSLHPGQGFGGDHLLHGACLLEGLLQGPPIGEQPRPHHRAGLRHGRHPLRAEQRGPTRQANGDGGHGQTVARKLGCAPECEARDHQLDDTERPPGLDHARRLACIPAAGDCSALKAIVEFPDALAEPKERRLVHVAVFLAGGDVHHLLQRQLLGRAEWRAPDQALVDVGVIGLGHLDSDLGAKPKDPAVVAEGQLPTRSQVEQRGRESTARGAPLHDQRGSGRSQLGRGGRHVDGRIVGIDRVAPVSEPVPEPPHD